MEKTNSEILYKIAEEMSNLANPSDKKRAMDIAQVSITTYLIGAALDGVKSIGTISRAIEELTRRVFDPDVIANLKPSEAIRLLDRAIDLYRTQVDVARQVTKETNWDRLAGLISELTIYEETGSRGLNDDLIRAIAEELASRLDPDTAKRVVSETLDEKNREEEVRRVKKKVRRVRKPVKKEE